MALKKLVVPLVLLVCVVAPCLAPVARGETVTSLPNEFDLAMTVQSVSGLGKVSLKFNTAAGGGGYLLSIFPDSVILFRSKNGRDVEIGSFSGMGLKNAATPVKVTVKSRPGCIEVLFANTLLLDTNDDTFRGGSAISAAMGGAATGELHLQPIEPIVFDDNFMRQPNEAGDWTYIRGNWHVQTIGLVNRGANPFSLESDPDPDALASAGYSFWSDYDFTCAAKGSPQSTMGMAVDLQNDQNYYLLRWTAGAKGSLDLIKVQDGKETVLASRPGGFIPDLWYQIAVRTNAGRLIVDVDRQRLLNVQDGTFGQGMIGLYSSGSGQSVWFDSVMVRDSGMLYDDFRPENRFFWQAVGDMDLGGNPSWANYTMTAQVAGTKQPMGLVLRYQDSLNYYVFNWFTAGCALYAVVDGKPKLLNRSSVGVPMGGMHTVQAGVEDDYLWAAIDGKRVVEGVNGSIHSGRCGFKPLVNAGKSLASLVVEPTTPPEAFDALTAEFEDIQKHPEMGGWSGPLHAWDEAIFGKDPGYWYKGNVFGNTSVKVPLVPINLISSRFAILLNASWDAPFSGYRLDYAAADGFVTLILYRNNVKVASAEIKAPAPQDPPPVLAVRRQGAFVYVTISDALLLSYHDAHPVDGYALNQSLDYAPDLDGHSRLGLIIRGSTPLDIPDIVVVNRHRYAETFHLAPVNWRPGNGIWQVTSRWSCQPGWTWYGGKDPGYAVNWFKSPMLGDQSIDYYAGSMMGAEESSGYEAWRDLNCAFCSDGVNLFSGYTLIIGGWNGTMSRLYRKGKMVAESDSFHFPPQGVAHRLWFNVHIMKQGGLIHVVVSYLDNAGQSQIYPLFDWTDPDPIPDGYLGFWTYDNGIMLARVVVGYQQKGVTPVYAADSPWAVQIPEGLPYPAYPKAGVP